MAGSPHATERSEPQSARTRSSSGSMLVTLGLVVAVPLCLWLAWHLYDLDFVPGTWRTLGDVAAGACEILAIVSTVVAAIRIGGRRSGWRAVVAAAFAVVGALLVLASLLGLALSVRLEPKEVLVLDDLSAAVWIAEGECFLVDCPPPSVVYLRPSSSPLLSRVGGAKLGTPVLERRGDHVRMEGHYGWLDLDVRSGGLRKGTGTPPWRAEP